MKISYYNSELKMPIMQLPLRCTLISTGKASILVSPIEFNLEQLAEIKKQGPVTDIVAPSVLHHLFVNSSLRHFPDATLWAAPGLKEKCPDINWNKILTLDLWPHNEEIELLKIEGVPRMAEVAMFCKREKTLVVTDLCFNLQNPQGWGASLLTRLMGTYKKFAVSKLIGRLMSDPAAFKRSIEHLLNWDFDKIVMAHGEILEHDGRNRLRQALKEKKYI